MKSAEAEAAAPEAKTQLTAAAFFGVNIQFPPVRCQYSSTSNSFSLLVAH